MGFIIQSFLTEILILITTFMVVVIAYFNMCYKYWTKRGVPTIAPRFPLGNNNVILPKGFTLGVASKKYYDYLKQRKEKFGGIYLVTEPNLVIVDPDYVKDILTKDFQYFVDRGFYYNEKHDPISANLFALDGTQWRELRVKLTPTFTSSKMKMMFQTALECSDYLTDHIKTNLKKDLDVKEILAGFTTDVIGSCAFGIECDSFKDPNSEFRKMGKKIFEFDTFRSIRAFLIANLPKLSLKIGLTSNNKDVRDFFTKLVLDSIKMRKETNFKRNDFLQILIDLGETANLSANEMAAQVFLFFLAGFESSSIVMCFALYELAKNPDAQEKLREEICTVLEKYNNEITYESLTEMPYLEKVFAETLRMYPPGTTLLRRCIKDYTLKDTKITIEKGIPVLISILGLHMDPEYYPEPERFDPERFSEENKQLRHPSVYLPFGDGPRNCIGLRFGKMQSKIGIVSVIKNFRVSVSPCTKPVQFDSDSFALRTINKVYLRFENLND